MAVSADFQAAMDLVDTETNALADRVLKLVDVISTSMTAEDVASTKAFLTAGATRLRGIAANPEVPVPPGPTPEFRRGR